MRASLLANDESVPRKLTQRGGRHFDHHVDATGQHFGHTGIGVGNRAEDNGLRACCFTPISVVAFNHHGFVRAPLGKFERPCAGRVAPELFAMGCHCGG